MISLKLLLNLKTSFFIIQLCPTSYY